LQAETAARCCVTLARYESAWEPALKKNGGQADEGARMSRIKILPYNRLHPSSGSIQHHHADASSMRSTRSITRCFSAAVGGVMAAYADVRVAENRVRCVMAR